MGYIFYCTRIRHHGFYLPTSCLFVFVFGHTCNDEIIEVLERFDSDKILSGYVMEMKYK